jgi:hypothetical protein
MIKAWCADEVTNGRRKLSTPRKFCLINILSAIRKKGKGVPLHAMEAHGGRGGIAPTHT